MPPLIGRSNEPKPGSEVVKIVLFSVTGLILAFVVTMGVLGSLRFYRHPERYVSQDNSGQPKRNRARGLTRAILDTIPIVNFAENRELGVGESKTQIPEQENPNTGEIADHSPKYKDESTKPAVEIAASTSNPHIIGNQRHLGCSICTEDFDVGEQVRILPCKHTYHPSCVDPWLLNLSSTCPMCRVDLDERDTNRAVSQNEL